MTESYKYRCAGCHEDYYSDWSEEEAAAEYEQRFGVPFNRDHVEALCDDCYKLAVIRHNRERGHV